MSNRSWKYRLQDILDAIDFVSENLEEVSFEEFVNDELLSRGILSHVRDSR